MKNKGFTLIEFMIVIAIVSILAAVLIPAFTDKTNDDGSLCKYGMKYGRDGKQIIGQNGGGIPCDNVVMQPIK